MAWLRRLVLPLRRVWNFSIGRLRGQRRGIPTLSLSLSFYLLISGTSESFVSSRAGAYSPPFFLISREGSVCARVCVLGCTFAFASDSSSLTSLPWWLHSSQIFSFCEPLAMPSSKETLELLTASSSPSPFLLDLFIIPRLHSLKWCSAISHWHECVLTSVRNHYSCKDCNPTLARVCAHKREKPQFSQGVTLSRRRGVAKLYYHVQSCGYEDVHVMWSMLQKSGHQHPPTLQSCKGAFTARS